MALCPVPEILAKLVSIDSLSRTPTSPWAGEQANPDKRSTRTAQQNARGLARRLAGHSFSIDRRNVLNVSTRISLLLAEGTNYYFNGSGANWGNRVGAGVLVL